MSKGLEQLEHLLEELLETLRTATVLVEEYRSENNARLQGCFNNITKQFAGVSQHATTVGQTVALPRELFEYDSCYSLLSLVFTHPSPLIVSLTMVAILICTPSTYLRAWCERVRLCVGK
jgi:hypothetical protein